MRSSAIAGRSARFVEPTAYKQVNPEHLRIDLFNTEEAFLNKNVLIKPSCFCPAYHLLYDSYFYDYAVFRNADTIDCPIKGCDESASTAHEIIEHMLTAHEREEDDKRKCKKCEKSLATFQAFLLHVSYGRKMEVNFNAICLG
jgi:hypothetical protein